MKQIQLDKVTKYLIRLKHQPFNEIYRIGSMLCLGFGDKIKSKSACKTTEGVFEIKETQKSKYAIHIDGLFRVTKDDKIVLTHDDMFKPRTSIQGDSFDEETFQWDVKGNNEFDEEIINVFDFEKQSILVKNIETNKFGDLNITFSNSCGIDIFIDTSEDEECWRFFEVGNNETPHIVITGSEYYEE